MSQMDVAGEAEISTRHLSFVETGKSQPSREMVLILASVLEVPLRERNALMVAAGYAPVYRETDLEAPEMEQVRKTLDLVLAQAEPYGALVMDSRWNLLRSNDAATRITALLAEDAMATLVGGAPNLLRLMFHPKGVRNAIVNWDEVARATIGRAQREVRLEGDAELQKILDEVLGYPDVPTNFRALDLMEDPPILIPVHFRKGDFEARIFSTVTTLGTAQDITLQELRIEVFYPADEASERAMRSLAESN
jgi:transcriptional regulator with XRE-family HTH domain